MHLPNMFKNWTIKVDSAHYLFLTFGRFPPEFSEDGAELLAMSMALASGADELATGATWCSNRRLNAMTKLENFNNCECYKSTKVGKKIHTGDAKR